MTQKGSLLKAGKGLASDVIANCCIQNFSGDITKWMQSPKTNIFSGSATIAVFWKASKCNLHSLGKKPQNRLRRAQEKEQQPQYLLKGQKVKEIKWAEWKQEASGIVQSWKEFKNDKQMETVQSLSCGSQFRWSNYVQPKMNKYPVISWNHCRKAEYGSTLFVINWPEITEPHGRTSGWNS